MDKRTSLKVLLLCVLLMPGCISTAFRDAVNGAFPPVNSVDQQVTALKASAAELAAFAEPPTVYLSLLGDDVRRLLPTSIEKTIKTSRSGDIDVSAVNVRLDLGPQEAIVRAGFDIGISSEKAQAAGTAEIHCAPSVERGALVLRPAAATLRLSSLEYRGGKSIDVATPLINAALRSFLDNVNGAIAAQRIPLRLHASKSIDLAQTLRQTPGVTSSTGTTVGADVSLGSSAVLITPAAIRVLGTAVFLTPDQFESSFKTLEARVKAGRTDPLTSPELAALAACSDAGAFAAAINAQDRSKVVDVCKAAETGLAPIKTEHFPTTSAAYAALAESFSTYYDGFMKEAQLVEPGQRVFKDETIAALSRPSLAVGLRAVLARANASATYEQAIPAQKFNELITPTTTDLKCTENAGGCDSDFSYKGFEPPGCDSSSCSGSDRKCAFGICIDVPWVNFDCVVKKAACEADKEARRQKYEVDKAAAKVGWEADKLACELKKATIKAGCQLNQGWLDAWASKEIARVEGSAAVPDLKVFAAVDSVNLAPDFSSLTIQYRLRADARVNAQAKLTPLNGGHLICAFPANLTLNADAHAEVLSTSVSAVEQPPRRSGDDLVLSYAVSGQQVALKFSPSLAVALFDQNTAQLVLSCPAPIAIVSQIPGFSTALVGLKVALRIKPDLLDSTRTIDIPGKTFSFTVPRQEIAVDSASAGHGKTISLYPEWGQNAIVFSARFARKW